MPLGWVPRARDFPRRNRLISGLSLGVVVVEAAKRSGSLITARMALEQNREVFAVPGSPLDPRAEGCNYLIQQGARLVTGAADIAEGLETADPARTRLFESDWEPELDLDEQPPGDSDRERLLQALSITPVAVDTLIAESGLSVSAVQTLLLEFDIAGRLEWSGGQLVALRTI
jgi:DNA processing protein